MGKFGHFFNHIAHGASHVISNVIGLHDKFITKPQNDFKKRAQARMQAAINKMAAQAARHAKSVEDNALRSVIHPIVENKPKIDMHEIGARLKHGVTHPEQTAADAVHAVMHPLDTAKSLQSRVVNPIEGSISKTLKHYNKETGGVSGLVVGNLLSQPNQLRLAGARAGSELFRTGTIKKSTQKNLVQSIIPGGTTLSNLDTVAKNLGVPKEVRKYSTTPVSSTFNYVEDRFGESIQKQSEDVSKIVNIGSALTKSVEEKVLGKEQDKKPETKEEKTNKRMEKFYRKHGFSLAPTFRDQFGPKNTTKNKQALQTCPPRNTHNKNHFVVS